MVMATNTGRILTKSVRFWAGGKIWNGFLGPRAFPGGAANRQKPEVR